MLSPRKDLDETPEREEPEKTGLERFWELIREDLASLLIGNLLFLLTSIPVVTIPVSLYSLNMLMRKIVSGDAVSCAQDYFMFFKRDWKRAYGAFFLTAVPLGAGGFGAAFYLRRAADYPVLLALFAFCAAVFFTAALSSVYLYGLLYNGGTLQDTVKTALVLGIAKPFRAVLAVLCYYALPALALLYFPFSGAYLALLGFSLPCLLGNFYIRTVLARYARF